MHASCGGNLKVASTVGAPYAASRLSEPDRARLQPRWSLAVAVTRAAVDARLLRYPCLGDKSRQGDLRLLQDAQ